MQGTVEYEKMSSWYGLRERRKKQKPEKEPIEDDLSEKVDYDIYLKKRGIYTVPDVEVVDF